MTGLIGYFWIYKGKCSSVYSSLFED